MDTINNQPSPQTQLPPPSVKPKNPVTAIIIVVLLIALGAGITLVVKYMVGDQSTNTEQSASAVETVATKTETDTGTVPPKTTTTETPTTTSSLTPAEIGDGEVILVATGKTPSTLRAIHIYNPASGSWVPAYDGYRELTSAPSEIIRIRLAAVTYTKLQVRTVSDTIELERQIVVPKNGSVTVNIDL